MTSILLCLILLNSLNQTTQNQKYINETKGIEFQYSKFLNLKERSKDNFHEISLSSSKKEIYIVIQIIYHQITEKMEEIYIQSYNKYLEKLGYKMKNNSVSIQNLPIKTEFQSENSNPVKSKLYKILHENLNNKKSLSTIYFFSTGLEIERGYIIRIRKISTTTDSISYSEIKDYFSNFILRK